MIVRTIADDRMDGERKAADLIREKQIMIPC
jgi:hypothetical protein